MDLVELSRNLIVKSGIQSLGFLGTLADNFLEKEAERRKEENLRAFFAQLARDQRPFKKHASVENEIAYRFWVCLEAAARTTRSEKAAAFAKILQYDLLSDRLTRSDQLEEDVSIIDSISVREWQALLLFDAVISSLDGKENEAISFDKAWPIFSERAWAELSIPLGEADTFLLRLSRVGLYSLLHGFWDDGAGAQRGQLTPAFKRLKTILADL